ncbi:PepSY-like domain-containing protein [Flagellimonas beolgyonensis]|uniref:PepSY-like domain-containing protein n=1 Tax=Flagellimonas beolgyonensis TaxID=864064 RepID=UPI003D65DA9C
MKNKKIIIGLPLAALLGLALFAFASNRSVPLRVKAAFVKKFPHVKKVKWDKESDAEWEAEFKMDGMEYSANFLEDGTWKETEHEIKIKDIPDTVKATLNSEFAGYEIEEAEISETVDGLTYEFEIEKGEEELEVAIDAQGKVTYKIAMEEDQEKE